jgi:predicted pyridoxine 5'-phosphate oxidase superfamily flavin-nucleotide-binding protein
LVFIRSLGFAGFRGNVPYLSVGNPAANDRIALILMDYAARRRLKIWARARRRRCRGRLAKRHRPVRGVAGTPPPHPGANRRRGRVHGPAGPG